MGSFEAPIVVPELKQAPLKVSSVVLSTQLPAGAEGKTRQSRSSATACSWCPT